MTKSMVCSMLMLFVSLSIFANEDKVVVMTDSPSFIQQVTNQQGVGTISSVYSLLFAEVGLPKQLHLKSFNRQALILEQNEYAACTPYRFKTKERAEQFLFSDPIYFMLHYKLYQQMDLPPLPRQVLDDNGHVKSLNAIAAYEPQALFVIISSFSYGDTLDAQVAKLPSSSTIEWEGTVPHNVLSKLFFYGRGQYALMFPSEVHAYLQDNPTVTFRQYRMANLESHTLGYMMCNRHPDSADYLNKINQAIKGLYGKEAYLQAHLAPYAESEYAEIKAVVESLQANQM
jgi:uncharacterized protein (TIGR02285 family)